MVFWWFQRVENGCIRNKRVKSCPKKQTGQKHHILINYSWWYWFKQKRLNYHLMTVCYMRVGLPVLSIFTTSYVAINEVSNCCLCRKIHIIAELLPFLVGVFKVLKFNSLDVKKTSLNTIVTTKQSTSNFPKNLIPTLFPLTPWYVLGGGGGVINVIFREIWRALFSCNYCFEIRSLVLLPTSL